MDLGIRGRTAVVCGSSRGLGLACARALAAEGVHLVLNARSSGALDAAAAELERGHDVRVVPVAADVTTEEGRTALLDASPEPDILVTNCAGPSPGSFSSYGHADWIAALEANMIAPLLLIRSVLGGMCDRQFGRIVNITSAMVVRPSATMGLSSGARAGLTAVVKGLSREVAAENVTINNILPERFDTDRQRFMAEQTMREEGIDYREARRRQELGLPARRLGRPEELGALCAFLCSDLAGFATGLNIRLDGGSHPGLF